MANESNILDNASKCNSDADEGDPDKPKVYRTPIEIEVRVKQLHELHYSYSQIKSTILKSTNYNISSGTIARIVNKKGRWQVNKEKTKRNGRPVKRTDNLIEQVISMATDTENPVSQRQIAKRLNISSTTVNRICREDIVKVDPKLVGQTKPLDHCIIKAKANEQNDAIIQTAAAIIADGEPLSQRLIAKRLGISNSNVNRVINMYLPDLKETIRLHKTPSRSSSHQKSPTKKARNSNKKEMLSDENDGDNESDDIESSQHSETTPAMAETTPGVVETTPGMGEATPAMVEATPGMVEATPGMGEAGPGSVDQATPKNSSCTSKNIKQTPKSSKTKSTNVVKQPHGPDKVSAAAIQIKLSTALAQHQQSPKQQQAILEKQRAQLQKQQEEIFRQQQDLQRQQQDLERRQQQLELERQQQQELERQLAQNQYGSGMMVTYTTPPNTRAQQARATMNSPTRQYTSPGMSTVTTRGGNYSTVVQQQVPATEDQTYWSMQQTNYIPNNSHKRT